jgi:hypothetical protein
MTSNRSFKGVTMFLTRSRIWRLVLFAAAVTCAILGTINDQQRMVFLIAGGVFVFVIVALWYADNRRDRIL